MEFDAGFNADLFCNLGERRTGRPKKIRHCSFHKQEFHSEHLVIHVLFRFRRKFTGSLIIQQMDDGDHLSLEIE